MRPQNPEQCKKPGHFEVNDFFSGCMRGAQVSLSTQDRKYITTGGKEV